MPSGEDYSLEALLRSSGEGDFAQLATGIEVDFARVEVLLKDFKAGLSALGRTERNCPIKRFKMPPADAMKALASAIRGTGLAPLDDVVGLIDGGVDSGHGVMFGKLETVLYSVLTNLTAYGNYRQGKSPEQIGSLIELLGVLCIIEMFRRGVAEPIIIRELGNSNNALGSLGADRTVAIQLGDTLPSDKTIALSDDDLVPEHGGGKSVMFKLMDLARTLQPVVKDDTSKKQAVEKKVAKVNDLLGSGIVGGIIANLYNNVSLLHEVAMATRTVGGSGFEQCLHGLVMAMRGIYERDLLNSNDGMRIEEEIRFPEIADGRRRLADLTSTIELERSSPDGEEPVKAQLAYLNKTKDQARASLSERILTLRGETDPSNVAKKNAAINGELADAALELELARGNGWDAKAQEPYIARIEDCNQRLLALAALVQEQKAELARYESYSGRIDSTICELACSHFEDVAKGGGDELMRQLGGAIMGSYYSAARSISVPSSGASASLERIPLPGERVRFGNASVNDEPWLGSTLSALIATLSSRIARALGLIPNSQK